MFSDRSIVIVLKFHENIEKEQEHKELRGTEREGQCARLPGVLAR
jgi:hypothetical protein